MSTTAISIEGLGKQYVLSHKNTNGDGLRHVLQETITRPFRALRAAARGQHNGFASSALEKFWALKGVNFEVKPGETVGVVGRNGAGKSTLLKILGRITEPTEGRVVIEDRVASLLEVGTGFHPELTGRENIFLNGAILGMSKAEIKRKFDEIVAFAEVEKFLDTPVKRYSSGMYVRLAFAVAAHLESQIMLVDEVIAVGDSQFQEKCLGKMRDVAANEGRTVLFVSHNMGAVAALCSRAVLLERGQLTADGAVRDVLRKYHAQGARDFVQLEPDSRRPSITRIAIDRARLSHGEFALEVSFTSPFPLRPPIVGVVVSTLMGNPVFASDALMHPEDFNSQPMDSGTAQLFVADLPLHSGEYRASVFLAEHGSPYDYRRDVLSFDFVPKKPVAANCAPIESIGPLNVSARWELK